MNCNHCGTTLAEGAASCSVCGAAVQVAAVEAPVKERVALGILGALIGAIIGGLSIVLLGRLGYVASISGVIIAFGTLKGYELLAKKLSKVGMVVSFALMLVTPFLAHGIDLLFQLQAMWAEYGVTLSETLGVFLEMIAEDSELLSTYLSELGMLYLFVAIGAFIIIRNTFRKK